MSTRRALWMLALGLTACGEAVAPGDVDTPSTAVLVDVADAASIDFRHVHGGSGEKFLFETMGSGVVVEDFDDDGLPEILLLQSGTLAAEDFSAEERQLATHAAGEGHRLFANRGGLRFSDVSAESGLAVPHYAMGAAVGDADGDGDRDLYVAAYGPDRFFINEGGLRFRRAETELGLDDARWNTGGCFLDADLDGDLDLYTLAYLDMPVDTHELCEAKRGKRIYCHVDRWQGVDDRLWINDGSGRFRDGSEAAGLSGLRGKGLAAVAFDADLDGDTDIFVANDGMANHLLINDGAAHFAEQARRAGLDLNADGRTEACMGTVVGDFDTDGDADLYVANFELETNTLYRNDGDGFFTDVSTASGAGAPSRPLLGFGVVSFDLENDGDLDLYVANGHILDNADTLDEHRRWAQPDQLLLNDGSGRFRPAAAATGDSLAEARVGRGAARGDLDGDGDSDLVVSNNSGAPWVLENRSTGGASLQLLLRGPEGRADAEGARVEIFVGERRLTRQATRGESYASHGSTLIQVGLGEANAATRVVVHWPDGSLSEHGPWSAGRRYELAPGGVLIAERPLPLSSP